MPGSNLSTSHKITHLYSSKFYEIQSIIISYEQLRHGNVKLFNQSKQVGQLLNWSSDPILLLLIHVSRVRLCATPETAAHQAPPSLGFSRQEHWSGCHFLLQCMKVKSESEVAQSCPTLSDPMDCSPPGASVHGIFQARILEWVAISFSRRSSQDRSGGLLFPSVEEFSTVCFDPHSQRL